MPKFIFISFLFFCTAHSFGQNDLSHTKINKSDISNKLSQIKKEKIETLTIRDLNETEIELLLKNNLCEILSIKVSDLLNESMSKKFKSNV